MTDEKLVRGISRWDLLAITINTIIGAGIFGLPSKVTALIGNYSLVAFIACAVIVAFIVLCFAEVSSRFTATGGMYLYAREAFGSIVGFEVGWLYWIVRVTTFAANCNLLLAYLGFFVPEANQGSLRVLLIGLVVLILTVVNFLGVRQSAILTNVFTIGKIVPLIIFAAVGLFFIQPENFSFAPVPEVGAFSSAILILIYAFVGFEAAAIPAGETRDPQRSVPFALMTALAIVAVLYILIQIVCIGTLPELAASERPLADAAGKFLGTFGAAFITIGALVSIFGNLNGGFLTASRMPFAMAEQGELPAIFGKTHEKFKTPYLSLLITAAAMLVLTVQSSFLTALTISTITRLIVYATTCAALPVFRRRENAPKAELIVPLGIIASILSLLLTVWLLTNVDFKKEGLAILILAVFGLILYFASRFWNKKFAAKTV
ncbi:MAG TPA: amino acid permease [Pyrinomonadaceae bacterium]|nr:amino acid permease [Pyrinomonadaceae bacterium]